MATVKEILEIEQCSDGSIHLHKEGAFWKAYQKSAFQVHRREPEFKVKFTLLSKIKNSVVCFMPFVGIGVRWLRQP